MVLGLSANIYAGPDLGGGGVGDEPIITLTSLYTALESTNAGGGLGGGGAGYDPIIT